MMTLKAPFPYFGGKSRVADMIWQHFGDVPNYIEPFCGSLAVLLARPGSLARKIETVNDADALLANFWRAVQSAPDEVARWADWPVSEVDLHARHRWLQDQKADLRNRLLSDPDHFDCKLAGWWVWGQCAWVGGGWCSYQGKSYPLPNLGNSGKGIHRQGITPADLVQYFQALSTRLRRVRIACGDWTRVLTPAVTTANGLTAVFLDPPYASDRATTYALDSRDVAHDAREWAIAHGDDPRFRIALCGFEGEHRMPEGWHKVAWKGTGFGRRGERLGNQNLDRERIWFSPYCRCQLTLFSALPKNTQEMPQDRFSSQTIPEATQGRDRPAETK